jgi:hypothetical protein
MSVVFRRLLAASVVAASLMSASVAYAGGGVGWPCGPCDCACRVVPVYPVLGYLEVSVQPAYHVNQGPTYTYTPLVMDEPPIARPFRYRHAGWWYDRPRARRSGPTLPLK